MVVWSTCKSQWWKIRRSIRESIRISSSLWEKSEIRREKSWFRKKRHGPAKGRNSIRSGIARGRHRPMKSRIWLPNTRSLWKKTNKSHSRKQSNQMLRKKTTIRLIRKKGTRCLGNKRCTFVTLSIKKRNRHAQGRKSSPKIQKTTLSTTTRSDNTTRKKNLLENRRMKSRKT